MIRFLILSAMLVCCSTADAQLFQKSKSGYSFDGNSYRYRGKEYVLGVDGPVSNTCRCAMCNQLRSALASKPSQIASIPTEVLLTTVSSDLDVIASMLKMAEVGPGDKVLDPGCGDGRILVEASKLGAKAIGIELNRQSADRTFLKLQNNPSIKVYYGDSTKASFQGANVVVMFMYPEVIEQLIPRILEMPIGSKVVSLSHDLPNLPTAKYNFGSQVFYLWERKDAWQKYQIQGN